MGAGQTQTAKLSVRSDAIGDTTIELRLLGQDGRPLPEASVPLSVQSTQFGSTLLVLIYVALGVVVLTAIARAIRRALRDDPPSPRQGGQPDGPRTTASTTTRQNGRSTVPLRSMEPLPSEETAKAIPVTHRRPRMISRTHETGPGTPDRRLPAGAHGGPVAGEPARPGRPDRAARACHPGRHPLTGGT